MDVLYLCCMNFCYTERWFYKCWCHFEHSIKLIRWMIFLFFIFLKKSVLSSQHLAQYFVFWKKSLPGLNNRYCNSIRNLTDISSTKCNGTWCNPITRAMFVSVLVRQLFCTEGCKRIRLGPKEAEGMYFRLTLFKAQDSMTHMVLRNENIDITNYISIL